MKIFFTVLCWLAAAYFFIALHIISGIPPKNIIDDGVFIYIILFAFFLLLPFAQTLEIGTFFKYSAKINEIKSEVKDFKEETRSLISLQNSMITNISHSVNHNVTVTVPSLTQGRAAEEQLDNLERDNASNIDTLIEKENTILNYIAGASGDVNIALMKLRRELEIDLRRLLEKELSFPTQDPLGYRPRLLTLRSLWKMFLERYPDERSLEKAFIYAVDVCNAAAHGQDVPPEVAEEALSLGLRVLDQIKSIR